MGSTEGFRVEELANEKKLVKLKGAFILEFRPRVQLARSEMNHQKGGREMHRNGRPQARDDVAATSDLCNRAEHEWKPAEQNC